MKHLPIDNKLFVENRRRFTRELKKNSIAIFNSNDEVPSNGDQIYKFVQNSDLYWLTGIEQEDTMLIINPDNSERKYREVLVLTRPNEMKEKWDGKRLRIEEAQKISGIETIVWLDSLDALLQKWVHGVENIYLNTNENDRRGVQLATRDYRYIQEMKTRFPLHNFMRSAPILKLLRSVKTKYEIDVTQIAVDITEKAFRRILQFIKPGVYEYEIEAEIMHEFLRNRASGEAYGSIFASGDRARTLHYVSNNELCKSGEVILMDFGAKYGGYSADLSRSIPVSGIFTKRQKEVYNACLSIHKFCAAYLKPGVTLGEYHEKVGDEATKQFIKLGLLTKSDVKNEDKENRAYRKYLYHGISHHLGVDVHDLGPSFTEKILEGSLLTIEPGIYIENEQLGIRIENNYWIKRSGNVDLMKTFPITAEEIESAMKRK